MSEIAEILKQMPLFEGLSEEELALFGARLSSQAIPSGTPVLQQGFASSTLFILLSGRVKVLRQLGKGAPVIIAEFGPLQIFGEMGIVDGQPASATVMADTDLQILSMSAEEFHALLESAPATLVAKLWRNLAQELTRRIRLTTDQVQDSFAINQALCTNENFRQFYKLYGP